MMNAQILENERIQYQVLLNGKVLTTAQSQTLAEGFVATLAQEQQSEARIVPITQGGKQLLMG
jgi:hypothetical protein